MVHLIVASYKVCCMRATRSVADCDPHQAMWLAAVLWQQSALELPCRMPCISDELLPVQRTSLMSIFAITRRLCRVLSRFILIDGESCALIRFARMAAGKERLWVPLRPPGKCDLSLRSCPVSNLLNVPCFFCDGRSNHAML